MALNENYSSWDIVFRVESSFPRKKSKSSERDANREPIKRFDDESIRKFVNSCLETVRAFPSSIPPQMRSIPLERSFVTMRLRCTSRTSQVPCPRPANGEASYFQTFVKLVESPWSCCQSRGTNSVRTLDFPFRLLRDLPLGFPDLTRLILLSYLSCMIHGMIHEFRPGLSVCRLR